VTVAPTPNKGGTCTLASITATANAGIITYASGASIPAGGCTIIADVTSSTPGTATNTIAAGALVTSLGNNPGPITANLVVNAAVPTVAKVFAPTPITSGGISTLTITLGNTNAVAATLSSIFTDTLPAGVTVAPTPNKGGTCTLASITATANAGIITYASGASIPGRRLYDHRRCHQQHPRYRHQHDRGRSTGHQPRQQPGSDNCQPGGQRRGPTVAKVFAPTPITSGGISTLT